MQGAELGNTAVGNYQPTAKAFMDFCEAENCQWLPVTEAIARLYIAHLLAKGLVQAASAQPYVSTISNCHDMGYSGLAKGLSVSRAAKGVIPAGACGWKLQVMGTLLSRHVSAEPGHEHTLGLQLEDWTEAKLLRVCHYVVRICHLWHSRGGVHAAGADQHCW